MTWKWNHKNDIFGGSWLILDGLQLPLHILIGRTGKGTGTGQSIGCNEELTLEIAMRFIQKMYPHC